MGKAFNGAHISSPTAGCHETKQNTKTYIKCKFKGRGCFTKDAQHELIYIYFSFLLFSIFQKYQATFLRQYFFRRKIIWFSLSKYLHLQLKYNQLVNLNKLKIEEFEETQR